MPGWYYFCRPDNMACHNLCTIKTPPLNYRALLGLSLKFCPTPKYSSYNISVYCDRFRNDLYTKAFMGLSDKPIPRLYQKSTWKPPIKLINATLQRRTDTFIAHLRRMFVKRKCKSNLLPYQRNILKILIENKDFLVINADKNLGPCIIERQIYIQRALNEHLKDTTTYKQLTTSEKVNKIYHLRKILENFINDNKKFLSKDDIKFLQRSTIVEDPLPKFYLTAKVHKVPWKTRPIVSLSGSLLHGLGRWIDKLLQPFVKALPTYIQSSFHLKELLEKLPTLSSKVRIGTCDAVSMYTNIDTSHALTEISKVLRLSPLSDPKEKSIIMHALYIVMTNNIFDFGDTTWQQIDGTAMGVSPSCCYAMLYFSPKEAEVMELFPELLFLKRYIDDIFYLWECHDDLIHDANRWEQFKLVMNTFGKLKWEFNELDTCVNFLDLIIDLKDGKFTTKLYEKAFNPYLYLPSHSSHSPGSLKGLLHGSIRRIIRLTTLESDINLSIQKLYERLLHRGYSTSLLRRTIAATLHSIKNPSTSNKEPIDMKSTVLLHLTYNPTDPKSNKIQELFESEIAHPYLLTSLSDLKNHKKERTGIEKLLISYHRLPNLGNLLSPRILKPESGPLVSSYIND
jgi:hypothetical protein